MHMGEASGDSTEEMNLATSTEPVLPGKMNG
jgi:hypothetical protein